MKLTPVYVHDRTHIDKVFIAKTRKNPFFRLKYTGDEFYLPLASATPTRKLVWSIGPSVVMGSRLGSYDGRGDF